MLINDVVLTCRIAHAVLSINCTFSTTEGEDSSSVYSEVTPGASSTTGSSVTTSGSSRKTTSGSSGTTSGSSRKTTSGTSVTTSETSYGTSTGTTLGSTTDETSTGSTYGTTDTSFETDSTESKSHVETLEDYQIDHQFLLPQDILNLNARHIRAEDPHWIMSPVPELITIIITASKHLKGPGLQNLKANATEEQWRRILEYLPLTVPFKYTLPVIDNGIYWERQCEMRWPCSEIWRFNNNWKTMLIERIVQEAIEDFMPESSDIKELEDFLKTFQTYFFRLQIKNLQKRDRVPFTVDLTSEDFDMIIDDFVREPEVHTSFLDFEVLLECLTEIKEFSFALTPSCLDSEKYQLSITDFNSFLRGLRKLKKLEKFRFSNGVASNIQLGILCREFIAHEFLKELNFSYNFIDDESCDPIGQLIMSSCPLEVLILKYNKIADDGAITITSALSINKKLRKLDVSLNWIGNKGGKFLAKVVSNLTHLEDINISNNKLGPEAGLAFAEAIKTSKSIRSLSIAENRIGKEVGRHFSDAVAENSIILNLEIKFCSFSAEDEDFIHRVLIKNRTSLTYEKNCSYKEPKIQVPEDQGGPKDIIQVGFEHRPERNDPIAKRVEEYLIPRIHAAVTRHPVLHNVFELKCFTFRCFSKEPNTWKLQGDMSGL
ncbi:dynein regulatory complex subunit 5 [Trichonephila inaurata madagascariensis]|uniref:Dynein regulatory complex subunit 5 n=2 Tax=Trichonephila inaurata madagascariensis TaxID=2747483 RepID=A0A8X6M9Y0_9ARAC|nr:dynein regulatory complex subunit 5 [Trichonephila inaurata madagascariensis]